MRMKDGLLEGGAIMMSVNGRHKAGIKETETEVYVRLAIGLGEIVAQPLWGLMCTLGHP